MNHPDIINLQQPIKHDLLLIILMSVSTYLCGIISIVFVFLINLIKYFIFEQNYNIEFISAF
jgi:hypothetical protein